MRGCPSPAFHRARFGSGSEPQILAGPSPSRLPRPRDEGQSTFYVDPVNQPVRQVNSPSTFYVNNTSHALVDDAHLDGGEAGNKNDSKIMANQTEGRKSKQSSPRKKNMGSKRHQFSPNGHQSSPSDHSSSPSEHSSSPDISQPSPSRIQTTDGRSESVPCSPCKNAKSKEEGPALPEVINSPNPAVALVRLYLMSYFPSGFWPRLITRLLADSTIYSIVVSMYELPQVLTSNQVFMRREGSWPEWKCWQTGVELRYLGVPLLRIKEAPRINANTFCDYRNCKLVIRQEQDINWTPLNLTSTSILELIILNETLTIQVGVQQGVEGDTPERVVVQPAPHVTASLMAKLVDHIDTLLEDWYPDLGARFVQNSRGMYLITRVVPCIRCLIQQKEIQENKTAGPEAWAMVDLSPTDSHPRISQPILINQQAKAGDDESSIPDGLSSTHSDMSEEAADLTASSASAESGDAGWYNTISSSCKMVSQTVGGLYNKTADATGGILPRFDRSVSGSISTTNKTNHMTI